MGDHPTKPEDRALIELLRTAKDVYHGITPHGRDAETMLSALGSALDGFDAVRDEGRRSPGAEVPMKAKRDAWNGLCMADDRTSPEEYPDMCLITRDELYGYMDEALEAAIEAGNSVNATEEG